MNGGFGRGELAAQAVVLVNALDAAGSQGLDWRGIAAALREIRGVSGFITDIREGNTTRCPVRRMAYRWMSALEATLLYEVCEPPHRQGGVSNRIRKVQMGQLGVVWHLTAVPEVDAAQRVAGKRSHPWREDGLTKQRLAIAERGR